MLVHIYVPKSAQIKGCFVPHTLDTNPNQKYGHIDLIVLKFECSSAPLTFYLLCCVECPDFQWPSTCIDVQMHHKNVYRHCPVSTETSLEYSMAHNIRMYQQQNGVCFPNHRRPLNISGRHAFHRFHLIVCSLFFLNQFL